MSNPAVYLLNQNEIHGNVLRIEDNLGEAIHIHYGDIRFSITVDEFEKMCDAFERAAKTLFELEGHDWDVIDKSSLDWDWLSNYEQIEKISLKKVRLGDLHTVRNIYKGVPFQRIVKLENSLFVEELTHGNSEIDKYSEVNLYGQSNRDRLYGMYEKIIESDYPFDEKYICVDSENSIFDGDHRAACLFVKYGDDYEIPVIELSFKNQSTIKEKLKEEKKRYRKTLLKTVFKGIRRRIKRILKPVPNDSLTNDSLNDGRVNAEIIKVYEWLQNSQSKYYFIGDNTLIVEDIESFNREFIDSCKNAYEGYTLLYSINKPLKLNTNVGEFIVWNMLCCKSRFENSLLPLDKFCNEYAWKSCMKDSKGIFRASIEVEILYAITEALLENMSFSDKEKKMIQENISVFEDKEFLTMCDKEFFKYSGQLIELLKQKRFDECISGYITNTSY